MKAGAVLVIGGSGGIGSAICCRLAQEWGRVVVGYHRSAGAAQTLASALPRAGIVATNLCDADMLVAAVGGIDRLAAVVVASGADIEQPMIADTTAAAWRTVIETELLGFTNLVAAILPVFRVRGGGTLVAVTSFANVHFPPGDALSAVPKAGVEALCRAVAKEEGRHAIRANCVAPGMVNAGLGARYQREMFDAATWDRLRRRVPLGRFADAGDIAEAVAFLASDRAAFITGQTIVVDGGQSL